MSPVIIGMLVWLGVILVLALIGYLKHRAQRSHEQALKYQRLTAVQENNGDPWAPLPYIEHDYYASLDASRERRGK